MTTENDDCNGDPQPLYEVIEEAPVTRATVAAQAFRDSFAAQFDAVELSEDDKKFQLKVADFDDWLVAQALMPAGLDDEDPVAARGKGVIRQQARALVNRASSFGKGVWPPFSIEIQQIGVMYEVRLLEYYAEKLPTDYTTAMKRYLTNKNKHWGQISAYMHSEAVMKQAPEVALRFKGVERMIGMTLKNTSDQLENLNSEIIAAHREARHLIASMKAL